MLGLVIKDQNKSLSNFWLNNLQPCDKRHSFLNTSCRHYCPIATFLFSARPGLHPHTRLADYCLQLLQIKDPSPRRRRFASESRRVPQVLHRKQLRCHRLPAENSLLAPLNFDVGNQRSSNVGSILRSGEANDTQTPSSTTD